MIGIPSSPAKVKMKGEVSDIQRKLDLLLDTHLSRLITQGEYQTKREALLNEKIEAETKMAQLEAGATG